MLFSIIVPAKNEQDNIGKLLSSIQRVNFPRNLFEVMVIDNGSIDNTIDIAHQFGCRVYVQPGVTISALRNYGASQARGKILAFIDADCTVSPDWLSIASEYVDQHDVVCFGNPPGIPEFATWVQKTWYQVRGKASGRIEVRWLESMNMFVLKDIFLKIGGFNEELTTCEDYDLSLRLQTEGKIISDSRLQTVHHGEARTILHFFKKELWRGTSNWQGFFSHGLRLSELPSLFLPLFYCLLLVSSVFCLLTRTAPAVTVALFTLFLALPTLYAAVKVRNRRPIQVVQLSLLLNVYFLARGLSLVVRR